MLTPDGYVGLDIHLAARVMGAGNGSQVVVSGAFVDAIGSPPGLVVEPLGFYQLAGITEPVELSRLEAPGLERDRRPLRPSAVPLGSVGAPRPA